MELARPELAPDPGLDRGEMEALQRDVAAAARFADDLGFDPGSVAVDDPLSLDPAPSGTQATLGGSPDGGAPVAVGVDLAFLDERAVSAAVALRDGAVIERAHAVSPLSVPYVPGLLAFREGGPVLDALGNLDCDPDLAVFDGSGRIHFRQAGIATHVGVLLDLPSIGVAKSLLCGQPDADPGGRPEGWRTPVRADDSVAAPAGTVLGHAYQSRQYADSPVVNPLYVSPGHRVSPGTTVDLVAALCAGYKLPEPTRLADAAADELKAEYG